MKRLHEERPPGADSATLASRAAALALSKQAAATMVLELNGISDVCDYFVICHGESEVQVHAIVDAIEAGLAEIGARPWHVEGRSARQWVLLDYVDLVVHVFLHEVREYYRLEDLWADAPRQVIEAEA